MKINSNFITMTWILIISSVISQTHSWGSIAMMLLYNHFSCVVFGLVEVKHPVYREAANCFKLSEVSHYWLFCILIFRDQQWAKAKCCKLHYKYNQTESMNIHDLCFYVEMHSKPLTEYHDELMCDVRCSLWSGLHTKTGLLIASS